MEGFALIYLSFALPFALVMAVICMLVRKFVQLPRIVTLVGSATLLFAPSWAPATIAIVPVPFGLLVGLTVLDGEWAELANWIGRYPMWHAISFPATAVVAYVVVRLLPSNSSLQTAAPNGRAPVS